MTRHNEHIGYKLQVVRKSGGEHHIYTALYKFRTNGLLDGQSINVAVSVIGLLYLMTIWNKSLST